MGLPERDGGEITLTGQKEKSWITLVVKDNGRGIPEEFDWEHADSLGFNLVLMLVRQLKGTISTWPHKRDAICHYHSLCRVNIWTKNNRRY